MTHLEDRTEKCPYCGDTCHADWVDVGCGPYVQCGPFHCESCGASQIGPHDEERELTETEEKTGWYGSHTKAGSSANTVNGKLVSWEEARENYRSSYL